MRARCAGGLQDWSYLHAGSMEITVELGCTKWPPDPAAALPALWRANRHSLFVYISHVCHELRARLLLQPLAFGVGFGLCWRQLA